MSRDHLRALSGGVAVVTGAGGGLGEGIARAAARAGMVVALADIAAERAAAVAADIVVSGGRAVALPTDVSDAAALDRLAARVQAELGDVRLLVNNAGIEVLGHIWDLPAATWDKALSINLLGVINGVRAFAPRMLAAGAPAFIANLASVGALGAMPMQTPYIVSKHAVLAFSECLALEIEMTGKPISVSAVLPGPVATGIFDTAPAGDRPATVEAHRATMQAMLGSYGMAADQAGQLILEGIAARRFWVSPHPEMMAQYAQERAACLMALTPPALDDQKRALLGR